MGDRAVRSLRGAALFLVLGVALTACASNDAPNQLTDAQVKSSAAAQMVGVRLEGLHWGEPSPGFPGNHDRFALLLGGGDGATPAFVDANLALVRDALEATCHIPEGSLLEVTGAALGPEAVKDAVARFAARARSPEALLLVYLTGLSVVDDEGAVQYLTEASRQKLDGEWEGSFTRDELNGWLAAAVEQAAAAGTALQTVLVTDVARPGGSAPSPGIALGAGEGWELHAFQHARAAPESQDASATPFTSVFVESLVTLAQEGRAAPVTLVHERAQAALEARTDGRQSSQLVQPDGVRAAPPTLVAPRRIAASVRVVDALDGTPVSGARVSLDSAETVEGDGPLPIAQLPGRHLLRVSAPGYLTRVEEFDIRVENAGRPLEVSLLPGMVHLTGWVSPADKVVVTAEGLPEGSARDGYHVPRARPAEDGSFELRLPSVGDGVDLVVRRGGEEILRKPLPAAPERFLNSQGDVIEGLGLVDLGPVRLPGGHPLELLREAKDEMLRAGGAGELPVPEIYARPDSLGKPEWTTEEEGMRWALFRKLVKSFEWQQALTELQALAPGMDPKAYEAWRGWLELQYCAEVTDPVRIAARRGTLPADAALMRMTVTSRLLAAQLSQAFAQASVGDTAALTTLQSMPLKQLDESAGSYRDELVLAVERRSYGVAATLLLQMEAEERWDEVLDALVTLGNQGPWGSLTFGAMRREVLTAAVEAELDLALGDGLFRQDWRRADRILNWMTLHGEDLSLGSTPVLVALAERIAVERVPADVRGLYVRAQEAFLAGDVVLADSLYAQLDGRMNGRYVEFIQSQRARLRPQLYVRYLKEGESLELAGRLPEAAAAYARALRYDRRAAQQIMRLGLPTPGVLLVTPDGGAGYSDIGMALAQSLPGAVVLVAPGVYSGGLELSGSRSLMGVGVGGEVEVVASTGSALTVPAAAEVFASGLTLRTEQPAVPTVRLEDARLVVDSCRVVASRGGPAVAVGGADAHVTLRRCEIPATDGDGVAVSGEARLDLVDCVIGLPGSGDGELRRFMTIATPSQVRVTDSMFGRFEVAGTVRLTPGTLARIQRANVLRVIPERADWPAWAVDGLTHTASIQAALDVAEPGATIRVAPGEYHESIQPERSVRIVADAAAPGEVVIDGGKREFGLRLDANAFVTVEGVTFRLHRPDARQRSEAVSVLRGHLELADCRIEAFGTDTSVPEGLAVGRVRRPVDAAQPTGELTPEEAEAAALDAVAEAASVVLRRCRITSDALGITVRGRNEVAVWDSEIVGRVAGVVPVHGGSADLVATTIRGCERGVQLRGTDARARLEACVLAGNGDPWTFDGGAEQTQLSVTGTSVR